jgi:hypothetical protein
MAKKHSRGTRAEPALRRRPRPRVVTRKIRAMKLVGGTEADLAKKIVSAIDAFNATGAKPEHSLFFRVELVKPYKWASKKYDMMEMFKAKATVVNELKDICKRVGLKLLVKTANLTHPSTHPKLASHQVEIIAFLYDGESLVDDLIQTVKGTKEFV